jgi:hypothetical protein
MIRPAHPTDEARRKRITSEILDNFVKENYDSVSKDFHSSLKTTLPTERLSEVWKYVMTNFGAFKKVISTTTNVMQGYNQVLMRCQFEKDNATLEATFNEDDKVFGLYIKP